MCGRASLRKLRGPAKGGWTRQAHINIHKFIKECARKNQSMSIYCIRTLKHVGSGYFGVRVKIVAPCEINLCSRLLDLPIHFKSLLKASVTFFGGGGRHVHELILKKLSGLDL